MNRSQYLAAIKATFPGMTARHAEGEFRISLSIDAIKAAYPHATHADAMARNESLAAYETDGESALLAARALADSWRAEIMANKAAASREAAAKAKPVQHSSHFWQHDAETDEHCRDCGCGYASDAAGLPCQPVKTIDCTPTWAAMVPVFLACLENGSEAGRVSVRAELRRMAALADERNVFAAKLAEIEAQAKESN